MPVALPTYVQIEPVGQCNLRCQMCSIQFRQDGPPHGPLAFMEFEKFTNLIDQFTDLQELHLQGLGEPMMHPRFFEMVSYAVNKGIRVTTNSNLTLLNQRRAGQCVQSGLHTLHVSIDGATAATYERIRVRAHFERVVENLERLIAIKKEQNSPFPRIHLVVVIMRQNLQELPELVRKAYGWTVEEMFVQHLCHDFGEGSLPAHYRPMRDFVQAETLLEEDPQRVEQYFNEARTIARQLGVKLRLPRTPYTSISPAHQCDWPSTGAYISYQGYAMPCCMVSTPDRIHFGNMAEQGVETTWNNASYEEFRRRLASDKPPEICQSCAVYTGTF